MAQPAVCEWCDGPLPPPKPRGRPRKFCSDDCRYAAKADHDIVVRAWAKGGAVLTPYTGADAPEILAAVTSAEHDATVAGIAAALLHQAPSAPVDQVATAVLEARTLSSAFARLARSRKVPKQLGHRCITMHKAIEAGLRESFMEVLD